METFNGGCLVEPHEITMNPQPVLLLSYFFSPCNLTPTERVVSWAKYLQNDHYYPIIVTRNWDVPVKNATTDLYLSSGTDIRIEKKDGYEVHYIPYQSGFKDRLFIKLDGTQLYPIYLAVSMVFNLLNKYFLRLNPSFVLCSYAETLIKNKGIKKMVVTSPPFEFLGYGHTLHRKTGIHWIADYRDDWSTSELDRGHGFKQLVQWVNRGAEKKYLSTATTFCSVSPYYVEKIGRFLNKKGFLLSNGYMPENYQTQPEPFSTFTITYVGSIYPSQPIELFLQAFKRFIHEHPEARQACLRFIGIAHEPAIKQRIVQAMKGFENNVQFTARIPKHEAIEQQARSQALLACAHAGIKGVPGSKLYEYIALKKPVILYPSDGDILEKTLQETQQGLVCSSEDDCVKQLKFLWQTYVSKTSSTISLNEHAIASYSRKTICARLAQALNGL